MKAELRAAIMATEQTRVVIIKKEKQGIVSAQCPAFIWLTALQGKWLVKMISGCQTMK